MSERVAAAGALRGFRARLPADPVPTLLASADPEVVLRVRRDVLGQDVVGELEDLARLPSREMVLRAADPSGALSSVDPFAGTIAALLRVFETGGAMGDPRVDAGCRWLVERIASANDAERLDDLRWFARGARALALLGHEDEPALESLFEWIRDRIRADGGWLPTWVVRDELGPDGDAAVDDPTLPSHVATTCAVARAFGASPRRRAWPVVRRIGEFLLSSIGRAGRYAGEEPEAWDRHDIAGEHPSRYGVLSAIAHLPFNAEDPRVAAAIRWVLDQQDDDGRWAADDRLTVDVLIALKRLDHASRICG